MQILNRVVNRMSEFMVRGKPEIKQKIEYPDGELGTHLTNTKKVKKYDYYICDFCGKEIKIENKWEDSKGGICEIPATLTKTKKITLALHNGCINEVIKEFKQQNL